MSEAAGKGLVSTGKYSRRVSLLGIGIFLGTLLAGCGGGGGDGGIDPRSINTGWITVTDASLASSRDAVRAEGEHFYSWQAGREIRCTFPDSPPINRSGVSVVWNNLTTGAEGNASQGWFVDWTRPCIVVFDWNALIPLEAGLNRIRVTASDPFGNSAFEEFDVTGPGWRNMSTNGAPSYSRHTAVWSGARMIVWGANGTGAGYDPVTDTWQSISSVGAPAALEGRLQADFSSVWAGSEMIVWGGYEDTPDPTNPGFTWVNARGRYRPATDSWQPMSAANAPSPRTGASVIWTGTEMIVWGGTDAQSFLPLNSGASYNPLTDTWRPITTTGAPSGRVGHTAVWTGTEMVIWGGMEMATASGLTNTGGRYNPTTDSWQATTISNAPVSRKEHTAVWTGNAMVIWGGNSNGAGMTSLNTGARYIPSSDAWQPTTTVGAPDARIDHTAVWTGLEMLVWGGNNGPTLTFNTGGRYNPSNGQWSPMEIAGAPLAGPRTAIWDGTEMFVWGGNFDITGGRYIP